MWGRGVKTRWEDKVRKIGAWKGIERRGLREDLKGSGWKREERGGGGGRRERENRMGQKSSLEYYRGGAGSGWAGIYDGTYGSDLLFRARVGALETGRRMRWKGRGRGVGYVGGNGRIWTCDGGM